MSEIPPPAICLDSPRFIRAVSPPTIRLQFGEHVVEALLGIFKGLCWNHPYFLSVLSSPFCASQHADLPTLAVFEDKLTVRRIDGRFLLVEDGNHG